MVEIKELYQKDNLRSLADDIREHYTDDVKNILLALIKGTQSNLLVQLYLLEWQFFVFLS